jgi:hypothetical protein
MTKNISPFIPRQVPRYIHDFQPEFVIFLQAYFEFLDENIGETELGRPFQRLFAYQDYLDVDSTTQEYLEKIYNEFLANFPKETLADRLILMKNIKDFYRSRGTEKSIKFLLKTVYGIDDAEIYYPKNDVLTPSSGKWFVEKALRVTDVSLRRNSYMFKYGQTSSLADRTREFYFPEACTIRVTYNLYSDFQDVAILRSGLPPEKIRKSSQRTLFQKTTRTAGDTTARLATEDELRNHVDIGGSRFVGPNGIGPKTPTNVKQIGVFEWEHEPAEGAYYQFRFGSSGKDYPHSPFEYSIITDLDDNIDDDSLEALELFRGTTIVGLSSGATGVVERAVIRYELITRIKELYLTRITGTFADGETIRGIDFNGNIFTAKVFSGVISSIKIIYGGVGYKVGDQVTFLSNSGANGLATVAQINQGNVASVRILHGGAGYRANDVVYFYGGAAEEEAIGFVSAVSSNNKFHPNNFTIAAETIQPFLNVALNAADYGFPAWENANANTRIVDALSVINYGPTGPITAVRIAANGKNYLSVPTPQASANDRVKSLGTLGRMKINAGGEDYEIGDTITFVNQPGQYGMFGYGNVRNVAANGAVTDVQFISQNNEIVGGMGYDPDALPSVQIISANGTGANVVVTDLLGYGDTYRTSMSRTGGIMRLTILNRGDGYLDKPTAVVSSLNGQGANLDVDIIRSVFSYPGRYLDDTGMVSSYNFLQDKDYYQNFSYVIRSKESIGIYRNLVKKLIHPAGLKLWGEFKIHREEAFTINTEYSVSNVEYDWEPSLTLDFRNGYYERRNNFYNPIEVFDSSNVSNLITFERNSNATYFNVSGHLIEVGPNVARYTANGFLREEQRTNYCNNSIMFGANVETNTFPTNWSVSNGSGVFAEVISIGEENGIDYIDIRWSGTPTSTSARVVSISPIIQSDVGLTWTVSAYVALVGGSFPTNLSSNVFTLRIPSETSSTLFVPNNTFNRIINTRTLATSNTAQWALRWVFSDTITPVDFTLRIGAPQLELGSFASTPIKTSNGAMTRLADTPVVPIGGWFNQSGPLSIITNYTSSNIRANNETVLSFDDDTNDDQIILRSNSSGNLVAIVRDGGNEQTNLRFTATQSANVALALATNDAAFTNSVSILSDNTSSIPNGIDFLRIGHEYGNIRHFNGEIGKILVYTRRLSNNTILLKT